MSLPEAAAWEAIVERTARPLAHREFLGGRSPNPPDLEADPRNLFSLPYVECIEAIADRLFPEKSVTLPDGTARMLRASDARIDRYVLFRATWTPDFAKTLQLALRDLNEACIEREGTHFARLSSQQQDAVLSLLEREELSDTEWRVLRSQRDAFRAVYDAVCEGFFGEPGYGGNLEGIGWFYSNFKSSDVS